MSGEPNTRLNLGIKTRAIAELTKVLDNIPKFDQMPIQDRNAILDLHTGKFPRELVQAYKTVRDYDMQIGSRYTQNFVRFGIEIDGSLCSIYVPLEQLPGTDPDWMLPPSLQHFRDKPDICRDIKLRQDKSIWTPQAMPIDREYVIHMLGEERALQFLTWAKNSAALYQELKEAVDTISDIFEMAKTAGQIKRMVPDLLQYLPASTRQAFEEQKRASSLPFEWAPYDKARVDRMVITVSKGHLLANMAKQSQQSWTVENMDTQVHARLAAGWA